MGKRPFRTDESIAAELTTRNRIVPLLERHGFDVVNDERKEHGSAITQVIDAKRGDGPRQRMHVRLCWRRGGRNSSENLYSAAQLRARLDKGGWTKTLEKIASRYEREGITHLLLVQDSKDGFVFAALVPSSEIPAIWQRQREVSDDLIERGLTGRMSKNHAANGSSPTIWLQDDRHAATSAVPNVLWKWPGVTNILALPRLDELERDNDTFDDLSEASAEIGRDEGQRLERVRSGYPRDPRVRAAVRDRANGHCERADCSEHRDFGGFLDVHHILGIEVSDRIWTCVALCPNCHCEAHFSPDRDAINDSLRQFASQFAE